MQLSSRLLVAGKCQGITWLQPSTLYLKLCLISLSDFTEMGGSLEADTGKLRLSRPQWLLMLHLYSTWCGNFEELNQHLVQDAMTRKLPTLVSIFKGFHISGQKTKSSITVQANCQEVSVGLGSIPTSVIPLLNTSKPASSSLSGLRATTLPVSPGRAQNRRADVESRQQSWLRLDFQCPLLSENPHQVLPLCAIHTGELHLNFDPKLNDWLSYRAEKAKPMVENIAPTPAPVPCVDVKSSTVRSCSRSPSHITPAAGLRMGSSTIQPPLIQGKATPKTTEKKETEDVEDGVKIMSKWFDVINALLLQVQIDPIYVYTPRKSLAFSSYKVSRHVKDAMNQVAVMRIILPSISIGESNFSFRISPLDGESLSQLILCF